MIFKLMTCDKQGDQVKLIFFSAVAIATVFA